MSKWDVTSRHYRPYVWRESSKIYQFIIPRSMFPLVCQVPLITAIKTALVVLVVVVGFALVVTLATPASFLVLNRFGLAETWVVGALFSSFILFWSVVLFMGLVLAAVIVVGWRVLKATRLLHPLRPETPLTPV